jgi:hypothetical protein
MLDFFSVSSKTDGATMCRIHVEPQAKRCGVTITIEGRITRQADESDATFRSVTNAEWSDTLFWERKAAAIAKAHSPFWRGETAR